jgi:glutathione S-transferase
MALAVSQQSCELREVVLAQKPAALLQASPKGTVPVLVHDDGTVLEQSLEIMLWALRHHDPDTWLPNSADAWTRTEALIAHNDGPFKRQLDRYKYPARHGLERCLADRDAAASWLLTLNTKLTSQACLAGSRWGLADAALAPFIRQFAHTDSAWFSTQSWPMLRTWLEHFEASNTFLRCMDKYPAWQPGQAGIRFPLV